MHPNRAPVCCQTPTDYGLEYETVSLHTADGLELSGWYIPSQNSAAVIVIHGYRGNRLGGMAHADILARNGYGVLLFDMRAHGESEGEIFAFGWESNHDVMAAIDYLQDRPEVDPERIGVLGLSTGAQVALQTAVSNDQLQAVVADGAGAPTLADALAAREWYLYPGLWTFFQAGELIAGTSSIPPLVDTVSQISPRPLFLISSAYGPAGEMVINRKYYEAADNPKNLWELSDAGHISGLAVHPETYEACIITFFDQGLSIQRPDDVYSEDCNVKDS
jgi:pimeloyl-ACP methyl ester carboxylesterase